jgi:hypothetical protein
MNYFWCWCFCLVPASFGDNKCFVTHHADYGGTTGLGDAAT